MNHTTISKFTIKCNHFLVMKTTGYSIKMERRFIKSIGAHKCAQAQTKSLNPFEWNISVKSERQTNGVNKINKFD